MVRGALGVLLGCFARAWVFTLRLSIRAAPALEGETRPARFVPAGGFGPIGTAEGPR